MLFRSKYSTKVVPRFQNGHVNLAEYLLGLIVEYLVVVEFLFGSLGVQRPFAE